MSECKCTNVVLDCHDSNEQSEWAFICCDCGRFRIAFNHACGDTTSPNDGLLEIGITHVNSIAYDTPYTEEWRGEIITLPASDWWWWGYGRTPVRSLIE